MRFLVHSCVFNRCLVKTQIYLETSIRLICVAMRFQMADPGGRGHRGAGRGVLHLASGV